VTGLRLDPGWGKNIYIRDSLDFSHDMELLDDQDLSIKAKRDNH
jgi:hypothetical protein